MSGPFRRREEEYVPRHGSADTGDLDIVDPEPRGGGLAQWSIRSKLLLLAMIPLLALLAGGALLVVSMGMDYTRAREARVFSDALEPAAAFTTAFNAEMNGAGLSEQDLATARAETDKELSALRDRLGAVQSADADLAPEVESAESALGGVTNARTLFDSLSSSGALQVGSPQLEDPIDNVNTPVQKLVTRLSNELASISPDRDATSGAGVLSQLNSAVISADDERRAIRNILLQPSTAGPKQATGLAQLAAVQDLAISTAGSVLGDPANAAVTSLNAQDERLGKWRASATEEDRASTTPAQNNAQAREWDSFSAQRVATLSALTQQVATQVGSDSRQSERGTLLRAGAVAGAALLVLIVVTSLLAAIARSVTTPLRRLRAGAVEIASVQLPAAVARIEQDGVAADVSLPPVLPADSAAGPETFEVARAVDDLGAEAVRLATAQVRLRQALDEAFVSMSRRSQSMVEKQLAIIDELESQEQDPDQLRNLFRLDHLAARMRRYNDNLLVLAGSAVRTRATAPVKIAELFRAATSEMEQYERVRLQPVSGASVAGTVTGELVHLLAELLDNAAMYSPPNTPIGLSAAFTADGGLQIEVVDSGVGISPGEIDRLNARLTQPESIDTQVPSRMGLFVVARLARRGGFGVLLQARPDATGTVALVRVPPNLVIGAPGNTGEGPQVQPNLQLRPAGRETPAAARPAPQAPAAVQARAAVARASNQPAPVQTGAAAAAAAAGVRSVAEESAPLLPRRTRGGSMAPDGRPVNAVTDDAPALFTPAVPATPAPSEPEPFGQEAAVRPVQPAVAPPTGTIQRRDVPPAETSPTGIPVLRAPSRDAVPPAAAEISAQISAQTAARTAAQAPAVPPPAPLPPALPPTPPPAAPDPLTAPTGAFRSEPNPTLPTSSSTGAAPAAWDEQLPTELAARAAATGSGYSTPPGDLIGEPPAAGAENDATPIFDQISVWFTAEPTGGITIDQEQLALGGGGVIDLRDQAPRRPSSRWESLGDQRWLATSAQAAAAPRAEGTTETGLPRRRPGANLLPSANTLLGQQPTPAGPPTAALPQRPMPGSAPAPGAVVPPPPPPHPHASPEADIVRGRLGSYQRGLANARRARNNPGTEPTYDPVGASLFTTSGESGGDTQDRSHDQGGAH
ncbi:ATP-binding protein [Spongisporangium articulatum]|uniref:histidine kinase n=1 Tax=Spongisporangium articulatum TaxID=3362603 RepID=A0ABW8AIY8_9ACTN